MTTSKPRVRAYFDHDTYAKQQMHSARAASEAELEALSRVATEEAIRKEQQADSEEGV